MKTQVRDGSHLVIDSGDGAYRLGFPHLHIEDPAIFLHYIDMLEEEVEAQLANRPALHKKVVYRLNKTVIRLSQSREILRVFLTNLVITRFLFPAVLLRFGLTRLLGVYSLIPFNIIVPTAYRMLKEVHGRRRIQRALGVANLAELDLLLVELVGYDNDLRVLTLVFHQAPETRILEQEILIVRRSVFKRPPDLPYASITDLERILGQCPETGVRLAYFKERHKGLVHPRTYAILLLRVIANHADSTRALLRLIEARGGERPVIGTEDRSNVNRIWEAFATLSTHTTWLTRMVKTLKRHRLAEPDLDASRKEVVALLERLRSALEREAAELIRARDLALYSYLYYLHYKRDDPFRARHPLGNYHDYLPKVRSASRRLRRINGRLRQIVRTLPARPGDEEQLAGHFAAFNREILAEGGDRLPEIGSVRRALEGAVRALKEASR